MTTQSVRIASITVRLVYAILLARQPAAAQAGKATSTAAAFLARIAGVYKMQFQNGFVGSDEKYQSEDILEVVPIDDHAAYVRMDLEFFNGHSGGIFGIAIYGKDSLIYDNGADGDARCVVEYVWSADQVVTKADYEKTPGCLTYHGARGSLDGVRFLVKKKQTIRYMRKLKDSREFKAAMEEYRKKH